MRLTTLSALLAVITSNGAVGEVLQCTPVASSCRSLPLAAAKLCSSMITSAKIPISTCQKPQNTVTVTATSIPTVTTTKTIRASTTTKTVTSTSTVRGSTISLSPTTIGTVTTTTTTETSTYSTLSIVSETTTTVETNPITLVVTESSRTTTSAAFVHTVCMAVDKKRDVFGERGNMQHDRRADYLPRDCSCFLTSTKLNAKEATSTTTITKPETQTKTTIIGGLVPTFTSTITRTTTTSIPGSTLTRLTSISTSTKTITSTTTRSTTSTTTSTSIFTTTTQPKTTTTTTSTSTTTINHPCEPTNIDSILSPFPIVLWFSTTFREAYSAIDNATPCCYQCWNSPNCMAWAYTGQNARCQMWGAAPEVPLYECATDQCPKGYHRLPWFEDPSDYRVWGAGYCGLDIYDGRFT